MGLVNPMAMFKQYKPLRDKLFRGEVKSVSDPENQGRIKVEIETLFKGLDVEALPWISMMGGFKSIVLFAVPRVGDNVTVFFPGENIYSGIYMPAIYASPEKQPEFSNPEVYGFKDNKNNVLTINRETDIINFIHGPSGTSIQIDNEGTIFVNDVKDVNVTAAENINLTANSQDININAVGGSSNVNVNGNSSVNVESSGPVNVTGNPINLNV